MSVRNALLGVVVAAAGFVVVTVAVTELVANAIEFSLLVGLPVGLGGGLVLGTMTYLWLGDEDATRRRRGAALAVFGVVFLAALISLVVIGGLPNSQALPIAAVGSVVASLAASLWYRRPDRDVSQIGS